MWTHSTSVEKASANSWKVSKSQQNADQIPAVGLQKSRGIFITTECRAIFLCHAVKWLKLFFFAERWVFHNLVFLWRRLWHFHKLLWWADQDPGALGYGCSAPVLCSLGMQGPWPILDHQIQEHPLCHLPWISALNSKISSGHDPCWASTPQASKAHPHMLTQCLLNGPDTRTTDITKSHVHISSIWCTVPVDVSCSADQLLDLNFPLTFFGPMLSLYFYGAQSVVMPTSLFHGEPARSIASHSCW